MPTEVTTDTRRALSHVAEVSKVQKQSVVIGANRSEARQELSERRAGRGESDNPVLPR